MFDVLSIPFHCSGRLVVDSFLNICRPNLLYRRVCLCVRVYASFTGRALLHSKYHSVLSFVSVGGNWTGSFCVASFRWSFSHTATLLWTVECIHTIPSLSVSRTYAPICPRGHEPGLLSPDKHKMAGSASRSHPVALFSSLLRLPGQEATRPCCYRCGRSAPVARASVWPAVHESQAARRTPVAGGCELGKV